VDCAIQVSPEDENKKGEIKRHESNGEILKLYLDRVDCAIQVGPEEDLKKETSTNINMVSHKFSSSRQWLNREYQEKQDVNINIAITPGSSNSIIDIKFNTMEIIIRKHKSSEEPECERKGKRANQEIC
jgi:hypothetical protein